MSPKTALLLLQILEALPLIINSGTNMIIRYKSTLARVRVMIEEDRDPTDEEWNAVNADIDSLVADIMAD